MFCNQRLLLQRLLVEDPSVLKTAPWRQHLEGCEECRREHYTLQRSLAVFRQFELQPPPSGLSVPSWERFSHTLARQRRFGLHLRAPLAAASLLVAISSGLLLWPVMRGPAETPPEPLATTQPAPQRATASEGGDSAALAVTQELAPAAPVRFTVRSLPSQGTSPLATFVEDPLSSGAAGNRAERVVFGDPGSENAPVLMFSSQQDRRSRREPIQVLPVFAPAHHDSGSLLPRALLSPLPIR